MKITTQKVLKAYKVNSNPGIKLAKKMVTNDKANRTPPKAIVFVFEFSSFT
jgi:hypothetical protein